MPEIAVRLILAATLLAVTPALPPPVRTDRWSWPLSPRPVVGARFAPGAHNWDPGHRGVDLLGTPGMPVRAVAPGTVLHAATLAGRGVVSVEHADGRRSTYEPVSPAVRRGDHVSRGQLLGTLDAGHAGCPGPACLHLGLLVGRRRYADPLPLLAPRAVLLAPR